MRTYETKEKLIRDARQWAQENGCYQDLNELGMDILLGNLAQADYDEAIRIYTSKEFVRLFHERATRIYNSTVSSESTVSRKTCDAIMINLPDLEILDRIAHAIYGDKGITNRKELIQARKEALHVLLQNYDAPKV